MTSDPFTVMRSMDAASDVTPDPQRAAALRENILRQPRAGATSAVSLAEPHPERRGILRGTKSRLAAMGATAAAGVAAFTFVGGGSPAYADWSAVPEPVSAHDLRVAETGCADFLQGHTAPLILTERRGAYVLLEHATADLKTTATCVVELPKGADKVGGGGGGGGLSLRPDAVPRPAADGLYADGGVQIGSPPLGVVTGLVGSNVRAVTVHVDGRTVQATVHDGHWAAVWTGEMPGESDLRLSFDLTLADGRVITHAPHTGLK